jgi:signal transduction histidine kinase
MQQERLEGLLEVGRSVVSELDLDALLSRILEVARELTGAQYAALGVLDEDRRALARFLTAGVDDETKALIGDLPRGRGVLGTLIREPRPLRLHDVGAHPESFGFPVGHPPMRSFLGVPVIVRGEAWGNLYLTEKVGGDFTDEDEETITILADWAAVAVHNARAFGAEHGRRRELERGVAAYEATLEIAKALAGETDLDVILDLVAKRGRALVSARSMLIELVDGDDVVVVTAAGQIDRSLIGVRIPLGRSYAGHVLRTRRAHRLSDMASGMSFALRDRVEVEAGLFVPLLVRGRAIGVLVAFDRMEDGPEFHAEDERLMAAFATSAGNAVATAQTVAAEGLERAMTAAEEERRRWARELHDETLQDIASLRVLLGSARQTGDADLLEQAVDQAVEQLALSADGLRSLITDLHPATLERLGVGPAIETLIERLQRRAGVPRQIDLDLDLAYESGRSGERLEATTELGVYRIVQEALTNVVRHADAGRVSVRVHQHGDRIAVEVSDDGRGFDPGERGSGFGLVGMRERVERLAGRLSVEAAPGRGVTVRADLPAARPGDADGRSISA